MSKAFKRLYKLAVSMLLVAGSIAFAPQHALAIGHSEPGTITIDKTRDDGNEGIYEITLTIEGVPVVKPADVILVVDTSTSMSGSKLTSLKNAANNFIDLVLDEDVGHKIGIVSFATGVTVKSGLTDVKATLTTAINGLAASGGTHLEGGIYEAIEILDMSAANRNKVIVVMSDGEPTYGFDFDMGEYIGPNTGSAQWDWGLMQCILPVDDAERDDYSNYTGSRFDFDFNATVGAGNSMNFIKSIFATGETCPLGTPAVVRTPFSLDESVIEIASQAHSSYSIFSIGLQVSAAGEDILQAIQTKGYFGASEANLEAIYAEIASSLNFAATNAVVTDMIGDHFDYVGVSAGYEGESVSYDLPSKILTWNVGNVGTTDRVLKYKISLHEDTPGGAWPTNEWADLDYTDWQGNPQNEEFPVPEVILGYFVELEASPEIGGSVSGEGRFAPGEVVDIIATANPGFTFIGWNEFEGPGSSENSSHSFDMPEHNVKWIANFRENAAVLIEYEATMGGSVSLASESLAPVTGVAVGSTAEADTGFSFVNWTKDGFEVSTDLSYIPPKVDGLNVAATYVANFVEDEDIMIEYVARPGGSVDVANETLAPVTDDAEGSTADPDEGFEFVNWTDEDENVVSTLLEFVPERVDGLNVAATYYANFEMVDYTFTFDPNHGVEANVEQMFNFGGSVAGTTFARPGYIFIGWTTDQLGSMEYIGGLTNLPAHDIYVYAQWEAIVEDFLLVYVTNQPGLSIPSVVFIEGETIVAPEPELEGFEFLGWYADEDLLVEFDQFDSMPAQDVTVYADWGEVLGDEDTLVPDMSDDRHLNHMGLFFFIVGLLAMIATKKEEEEA